MNNWLTVQLIHLNLTTNCCNDMSYCVVVYVPQNHMIQNCKWSGRNIVWVCQIALDWNNSWLLGIKCQQLLLPILENFSAFQTSFCEFDNWIGFFVYIHIGSKIVTSDYAYENRVVLFGIIVYDDRFIMVSGLEKAQKSLCLKENI